MSSVRGRSSGTPTLSRSRKQKSLAVLERLEERTLLSASVPQFAGVMGPWPAPQNPSGSQADVLSGLGLDRLAGNESQRTAAAPSDAVLYGSAGSIDAKPSGPKPLPSDVTSILWQGSEYYTKAGQWIVRFDDLSGTGNTQVAALDGRLAGSGLDLKATKYLGPGTLLVQAPADLGYEGLRSGLSSLPGFQYAEPNFWFNALTAVPDDPYFSQLYGLQNTGQEIPGLGAGTPGADIDAVPAWDSTTGSSSIVVAVVDTGVDYYHEDLAANMWRNLGEIPDNGFDDDGNGYIDDYYGYDFINNDSDPYDDYGHGTHCAGTIGAVGNNGIGVAGVNWTTQIMALKWIAGDGFGTVDAAISALNYATMMSGRGVNVRITSNSWHIFGPSEALKQSIADQGAAGILSVFAAGNDGQNRDLVPDYPSSYSPDLPNMITVAATDNNDNIAWFSAYGSNTIDLGAPGVNILSTTPGNTYSYYSGTSMATPHVAGVAALAWSLAPSAPYQQIRDAILGGVDPIPALATDGPTPVATGGRLNAHNTLQLLGMTVLSTDPANGSVVSTPPSQYVVNFSIPYDPATVDASDLTVNGIPADGVALTDADTLTFTFMADPVTFQGLQTMEMAAGAVAPDPAVSSLPFLGFSGSFRYDALLLEVVATTPPPDGVFSLPGPFLFEVSFNEPVDPGSVQPSDLVLSGVPGAVVSGAVVSADGQTVTFTLDGMNTEGILVATIPAGAVTDVYGNPSAAFMASYNVDFGTTAYPVPLQATNPLGSWIYGAVQTGWISPAGDTDSFTISIDQGQTITVLAEADSTLRPMIQLSTGGSVVASSTASEAGADALIQTYRVPNLIALALPPKTYTVTVSGAGGTTGAYSLKIILNAALETEGHGGAGNDTSASAQSLENSFVLLSNLPGSSAQPARGAVLGQLGEPLPPPVPSFAPYDNGFPLNIGRFGLASQRYQQIYAAGQFARGGVIGALQFALSSFQFPDLIVTPIDMQINLGYAATTTASASANFDSNIGAGFTTVFDGIFTIPGGGATLPSNVLIDVDDLFNYDPSLGDLLVEFRVRNPAWSFQYAAGYEPGTTTRIWNFDLSEPYGYVDYGFGLSTQFLFDGDEQDNYTFSLSAGQQATIALTGLGGGAVQMTLFSSSGAALAMGSNDLASNTTQVIRNFVASTGGSYRIQVTGDPGAKYSLVVTRNADFDAESNNDLATAQPLIVNSASGAQWAMGHVQGGSDPFSLRGTPVEGGLVLTGTNLRLGINPDGSFITNDLSAGIEYLGNEFVIPGSPLATFTIASDGFNYTNGAPAVWSDIPVAIEDVSSGSLRGARIVGMVGDGLLLERVVLFQEGDEFATVATRLQTIGDKPHLP